jgi:pilus assembly protein Flp/PilA
MTKMMTLEKSLKNLIRRETGATVVEYAVILALFAVVVLGAIVVVSGKVNDSFDGVVNELANSPGTS